MKKIFSILTLFTVLVMCGGTDETHAANIAGGMGIGVIMQSGYDSKIAWSFSGDIPLLTKKSANYTFGADISLFFADRSIEGVGEIEGLRIMLPSTKYFTDNSKLFAMIGPGWWVIPNSEGTDVTKTAFYIGLGYELLGMSFKLGVDLVPISGASDIVYPNFKLNLLK